MNTVLESIVVIIRVFICYVQAFIHLFYKPKKEIGGRTAVITGGGGGIGQSIAKELAQRKVRLALWDINQAAVDEVKNELAELGFSNVYGYKCDVTSREDVQRAAAETRKDLGEIDFLFNNAGVLVAKDILDLTEAEIRRTFEVNLISQYWTIQEFLPSMLKKNYGHIINIASTAGKVGVAWLSGYCASKFGVVGLSESLRLDILRRGKQGVKVTAICPSFVNTNMLANVRSTCQPHSRFDKFLEQSDVGEAIVRGIETDDFTVYIPSKMFRAITIANLLPKKAQMITAEYGQSGFFPKNWKLD